MNEKEVKSLISQWANLYFVELYKSAPHKTGFLKQNIVAYNDTRQFGVMIDVPHMKFTEERWTYNSRWKKTLVNPNEKWLLQTVNYIVNEARLKGAKVNES